MKIVGIISLIVIIGAGSGPYENGIPAVQGPDFTGFIPGNWQHSPKPQEDHGCS